MGATTVPLLNRLILFGRTLDGIIRNMASPTLLYSLTTSPPEPKSTKEISVDTGITHQVTIIIRRVRESIISQSELLTWFQCE